MTELDRLGWAVDASYRFGQTEVGIRATSREFGVWLDKALVRYQIDAATRPYYSIVIADSPGAKGGRIGKERYHILYRGTIAIARTPSIQVLVQSLRSDMETFFFPDRNDAVYTDMAVVTRDGTTALVPHALVPFVATLGRRRIERAGLTFPAETAVAIDRSTGEVIPIEPRLELRAGSLDRLADVIPGNGETDHRLVVDRPIQVDAVVSIGWGDDPIVPVSRGAGLYRLAWHTMNLEELGGTAVESLRRVVEKARCYEMGSDKPATMLGALLKVFEPT